MKKTKQTNDHRRIQKRRLRKALSRKTGVTVLNMHRLGGIFITVIILFAVLTFRLAYWQIVRADDLNERAVEMQDIDSEIEPVRGAIYDANGIVLAKTVTEYTLYAYTQTLYKSDELTEEERKEVLNNLKEITGLTEAELLKKLQGSDNLTEIASGLTQEEVEKAQELYADSVVVKTNVSRDYPNGDFASHLIGFVDSDNSGRNGLEYQYNTILAGTKGRNVRTTDSQGNTLSGGSKKYYQAEDGSNLVTTIDSVIQNYAEEAVAAGEKKTKAESITCIVMSPKTGNVLAMVNYPSYDPGDPYEPSDASERKKFEKLSESEQSDYLSEMWTNAAISSAYEPGSTFKLVTAASALESGTANDKSTYNCPGYIKVGGWTIKCWTSAHGKQSLKEAVGNSCNPALATVAMNMGAETFYDYIDQFGFCDKTGIDLPGETDSIIKDASGMADVDLATTGFGQGIAITPIQLMCAVNAIGNDGVLMKPKVVQKITSADGESEEVVEDTEVRRVLSSDVADEMCDIMQYYVEEGGGTTAYIPGYRIGGKTGTAYIAENGGYSSDTVASFIAQAPMDDPQVTVLVMVTKPKGTTYGATAAGPIVKQIMSDVLPYLGVERKYSKGEKKETSATVSVPNVTDMDSSSAINKLSALGLKYKVMPADSGKSFHVVDQYPKAGTKVEARSTVYIYSE